MAIDSLTLTVEVPAELRRHLDALEGMGAWRRFWYIARHKREIDAALAEFRYSCFNKRRVAR